MRHLSTNRVGLPNMPKRNTIAIKAAKIYDQFIYENTALPYGLKSLEVIAGIQDTYRLLHQINKFLVNQGLDRLEDLLLGNSLSGLISEVLVKSISNNSKTMVRNEKIGGHPDLIPRGKYPNNEALKADEGVEIKSSLQHGGWQGHNPENVWLLVFRYTVDTDKTRKMKNRAPITFVQVLAADIKKADWQFSGRKGDSRRTPTASVIKTGMEKLRRNPVYQDPNFVVGDKKLRSVYLSIPHK